MKKAIVVKTIAEELLTLWQKSNIPTRDERRCKEIVEGILQKFIDTPKSRTERSGVEFQVTMYKEKKILLQQNHLQ